GSAGAADPIAVRQCEKVGENRHIFRIRRRLRNQSFKFAHLLRRLVATLKSGSTFELTNNREESAITMMRRAKIAQSDMRFTLEPLIKRECNVRLANPRLPCKHYYPAALLHELSPNLGDGRGQAAAT